MEDTEIEIQISPMPNAPQPKSAQNKVHRNESIMGPTVQWFSSIEEANEAIKEHEIKLQCRYISKRKMAYDADRQLHIHWDQNYIPYILEGSSRLECQHGKNRFKAGTPKKQNENPKKAKKTYNCVKESIKRDCPAGITISEVCRFPLYKLGSIGKQRHRKREMAKFLRQLLQKKESINSESGCYVKFPTEGDHKGHVLGETIGNYQQMDKDVINQIKKLVSEGVTCVNDVKERLHTFVVEELFRGKDPPDLSNRRYFPSSKNIRNHCYIARYNKKDKSSQNYNYDVTDLIDANQRVHVLELLGSIKETMNDVSSAEAIVQTEDLLQQALTVLKNNCRKVPETPTASVEGEAAQRKRSFTTISDNHEWKYRKLDGSLHSVSAENRTQVYQNRGSNQKALPANVLGTVISPKRKRPLKILPEINLNGCNANEELLRIGPHTISYLELMSIEGTLNAEERKYLLSYDKNFKVGRLCDSVINSYLWRICSTFDHVVYADSTTAHIMQFGGTIDHLWQDIDFENITFGFIPWNTSEQNWVLLVIDFKKRKLLYLDPNQSDDVVTSENIYTAKCFVERCMMEKFGFSLTAVATNVHKTLHSDGSNCGVYICMYANWLANGLSLSQSHKPNVYRKEILNTLSMNCSLGLDNKTVCKVCQLNVNNVTSNMSHWLECVSCRQLYHAECVGMTEEQIDSGTEIICPQICFE